ncbi:hypothetical protein [Yinghuangia sp. ASG 101]|uniref:hypothetical protein n=1 Tax=Yinghuangia sp. ASG 101 TaxID=2896848 RepID=UPI0022B24347|nr:hypothetical protein [Yinghuangia sp. ASG 101]
MTTPEPAPTAPTPPTEADAAALLDAGAILAPGTAKGDDVDVLTARTYTHGVLDDRRIVRLVPGTLGGAEDLALDFLGLAREGDAPEVGLVRRESLGFPAWALVNDPANGHHALALVRDIERLDRQARSKPGAAKDGFDALGTTLGRAVPHFLPTFYEQAARIFLAHENTTYAATFFGKAREAERVHNLPVEEDRLRAVFLEFAFAGALTAKALKEYAKDLSRRLAPEAAWAEFRQLCVERCAAGVQPYAGLAEDARAMIRAIGGGAAAQSAAERELLTDLLPSPAMVRAPLTFWKTFAKSLTALAAEDTAVCRRLLEILPRPSTGKAPETDAFWLSLLLAAGADKLLTTPGALEPGSAADWLGRWARHTGRGWGSRARDTVILDLAARMAPALIADGVPADLFTSHYGNAAPDLVDVCLAHGIPLADPRPGNDVDLASWFQDTEPGRRDLVAFGADPRYAVLLRKAVGELGGDTGHIQAASEHPVLRVAMHDWLDERVAELGTESGIPGARAALERIMPFRAVAADVHPDAVARVHAFDVAPVLARTLRTGIFDELGWPALDEAMRLLGIVPAGPTPGLPETDPENAAKTPEFRLAEAWPALIVATAAKAVVVGPDRILLDHDLRIPDKLDSWAKPKFRYVDGDLLVVWWADGEHKAYWSSRPAEIFEPAGDVPGRWGEESLTVSVPHPRGGRVSGGRVLHAGDTELPPRRRVLSDGIGHWSLDRNAHPAHWREYDPVSGELGRASFPSLLAAAVADGGTLFAHHCALMPLQPGLEDSPFGTDGTLVGRWVRVDEHTVTAGTADGHTVTLPVGSRDWNRNPRRVPVGGLRLPGGARPIIVEADNALAIHGTATAAGHDTGGNEDVRLGSIRPGGRGGDNAAGTPLVPALDFWHALRPRDTASSEALRAVADTDAAALLAGAADEYAAALAAFDPTATDRTTPPDPVPLASVATVLPGVTHPGIVAGAAGVTRIAASLNRRLAQFGTAPEPAAERPDDCPYRPEHGDDATVDAAARGLHARQGRAYGVNSGEWTALNQIRAVAALLRGDTPGADGETAPADTWTITESAVRQASFDWSAALGDIPALLVRATAPTTSPQHREALALFAEELADPAFHRSGRLRRVILCAERRDASRVGQVLRRGDRVVVITHQGGWGSNDRVHWIALDHDPSGEFGAVDTYTSHEDTLLDDADAPARVRALVDRIRESGAVAWHQDTVDAFVAATGARRAEAALLFAGLPDINGYGRIDLDADQRAVLGVKATEAGAARTKLAAIPPAVRSRLLAAQIPADPAAWWSAGPDGDATAAAWKAHFGDVLRLPESAAADANAAGLADQHIDMVLNPEANPVLTGRTRQRLDADGNLVADDPGAVPHFGHLAGAVRALRWIAYRLPYGDPFRAPLPRALTALRERLADPELLMDLGMSWMARGGYTSKALREAETMPETGGADADGFVRIRDAIVLTPWYEGCEHVLLRVAGLTGPDDPDLTRLQALCGEGAGHADAWRAIVGPDLERVVTAGVGGPVGYAQDASFSAPDLVAEVAETHGITPDAATLYLQLLALPDPTDRNTARWTGWKPARLKAARAALAETDLVVSAKRARAGRTLFLPGGWHEFRKALPLETWKGALYPVRDGSLIVPDRPVAELFRTAWQRVRTGDAPGFEQLQTRTTRRGRRR